jgi:hypothetical protein
MYRLLLSYVFLDPFRYLLRLDLLRLPHIVVRRRRIGFEITASVKVLDENKHSRGSQRNSTQLTMAS